MAVQTPICDFNDAAIDFKLPDTNGKWWSLEDCFGEKGLLVMFICNHCPYVKAILADLVIDTKKLKEIGINSVAIMSNDIINYPDDAPEHMATLAATYNFSFPYLFDETQQVARDYGAVCTPDFFGYNSERKLQYRGRFDNRLKITSSEPNAQHELLAAMQQVAMTAEGPQHQMVSIGCSIKWKNGV